MPKERISIPHSYSKRIGEEEIEEGILDYLHYPQDTERLHAELAESFELERTDNPLKRKDIEKEAREFLEKNFDRILPVLLMGQVSNSYLLRQLGITNEQIRLLGTNYFIREEDGEPAIYIADEYNPDGKKVYDYDYSDVALHDLLALAWAKNSLRIDTRKKKERKNR